jgi:hypothetical protein
MHEHQSFRTPGWILNAPQIARARHERWGAPSELLTIPEQPVTLWADQNFNDPTTFVTLKDRTAQWIVDNNSLKADEVLVFFIF